jgi:hypothetical protein
MSWRTKRAEFSFENPVDSENEIHVWECECGAIAVSVLDEQAVDSYNSTFVCDIYLPREQAVRLRDFLTALLSKEPKVTADHSSRWSSH